VEIYELMQICGGAGHKFDTQKMNRMVLNRLQQKKKTYITKGVDGIGN
jgi:hypothetical protein